MIIFSPLVPILFIDVTTLRISSNIVVDWMANCCYHYEEPMKLSLTGFIGLHSWTDIHVKQNFCLGLLIL